jgi:hypothetical protein
LGSKPIVPLPSRLATEFGGPGGCDLGERVSREFGRYRLVAAAGVGELSEAFPGFCQSKDDSLSEQALRPARHQRRVGFDGSL